MEKPKTNPQQTMLKVEHIIPLVWMLIMDANGTTKLQKARDICNAYIEWWMAFKASVAGRKSFTATSLFSFFLSE